MMSEPTRLLVPQNNQAFLPERLPVTPDQPGYRASHEAVYPPASSTSATKVAPGRSDTTGYDVESLETNRTSRRVRILVIALIVVAVMLAAVIVPSVTTHARVMENSHASSSSDSSSASSGEVSSTYRVCAFEFIDYRIQFELNRFVDHSRRMRVPLRICAWLFVLGVILFDNGFVKPISIFI